MNEFDKKLGEIINEYLPDYFEGGAGSQYIYNNLVNSIKQLILDSLPPELAYGHMMKSDGIYRLKSSHPFKRLEVKFKSDGWNACLNEMKRGISGDTQA